MRVSSLDDSPPSHAYGRTLCGAVQKVLVVHDGVTPGGKPIDGFVKLAPGNPYVVQTLESTLEITGGDAYNPGLIVTQPARFDSLVNAPAGIQSRRVQWQHEVLDYAPTVNLDLPAAASPSPATLPPPPTTPTAPSPSPPTGNSSPPPPPDRRRK